MMAVPSDIKIRHHWKPGDVGYITYLHGVLYGREQGWDHTFDAYVAGPLSDFALSYQPDRSGYGSSKRMRKSLVALPSSPLRPPPRNCGGSCSTPICAGRDWVSD